MSCTARAAFLLDINDCPTVNPCNNGATCVDGVNDFSCICASGYSGIHCETSGSYFAETHRAKCMNAP